MVCFPWCLRQTDLMELTILIATLATVLFVALRGRSAGSKSEYWINNRETPWWLLAVTVSSSTVGAGTIFGTATVAYFGGNLGAIIGVTYALGIIVFGLLIAPRICDTAREQGRYSLGDFIAATTGPRVAKLSAAIFSLAYLFNTSAQFAAMSYIIGFLADIDYVAALGLSGLCILAYTSIGGIRADMRTDMVQLVLFALAIPLLYLTIARSNPDVWTDYFALPTEMLTGTAARGPVFLLAAALLFPLSVIASVDLWQRSFAASSARVAKVGFVAGGFIMICLFVSFSLLGTFAYLTDPNLNPNEAILHFTEAAASPLVLGLLISGLFAGILSTVDTMALATALSVSKDFFGWQDFWKQRVTVASTILFAMGAALVIPDVINLIVNAMSALLVLLPVILGVFFPWWRHEPAVRIAIIFGIIVVFAVFFLDPLWAFVPGTIASLGTFVLCKALLAP